MSCVFGIEQNCEECRMCEGKKRQTNADRIRSMTNKELAESRIDSIGELHKKYKAVSIAKHLFLGFLNYAEEVLKGKNEEEWICPACGKFRNPHDKFCRHCGAKIGKENDNA